VFLQMDSPTAAELRRQYYATVLRHMGANVRIGCGVKIENPQRISLGDNVCIDDRCTLIARSERGITLGDGVNLKHGVYLDTEGADGYIEIGNRAYIGTGCCLHGHQGLVIGEDTLFAQNITITPYSHKFEDPSVPIIKQGGHTRYLDHTVYHVDGGGNFAHVPALCELERLQALQIAPGAGKPSALHYIDTLKTVQAAGKNLQISLAPEQIQPALEQLSARGLFISTWASTEQSNLNIR